MTENKSGLVFTVSGREIHANCPEPIRANIEVVPYTRKMNPQHAIDALNEGYSVLISDFYSSGLAVLAALKKFLRKQYSDPSFEGQRKFRAAYHDFSQRVVLIVRNQKLVVKKSPEIGWFEKFYPEYTEFLLPFSQVQGLNSSWQWYEKGMSIPGLNNKIHPWYGTYFPTRFDHLTIFDHWLQHYKGEKKSAIDVGAGSGVLSFQLLKYGFEKVFGTDTNPNAIIGLQEDLKSQKLETKMDLRFGDLFAGLRVKSELIVFNPPWLPATYQPEGIDTAVYFNENLFPRFFEKAAKRLKPGGKLVILFSNLAQITNQSKHHPIEAELAGENRFQKEYLVRKKVKPASKKTKRDQHWRSSEMVELWVLKIRTPEEPMK